MDPLGYSTGKEGGSIREAGGAMGAMAAAKEELYFRQEDEKKFQALRDQMEQRKNSNEDSTNKNNSQKISKN